MTLAGLAAMQGVDLEEIGTSSEGMMDARGFFRISDEVNRGYKQIKVSIRVSSDTDIETLTAMAMHSPVYEMVSRAVPVEFEITRI